MSDCIRMAPLMQGFIDDELDAANVVHLEAHIADCRHCSDAYNRIVRVSDIVRSAGVRHRTPAHLHRQIEQNLVPEDRPPAPRRTLEWAVSGTIGALAASLALTIALPMERVRPIEREIVANHVRSLLSDHLTDVRTSNEHQVRPWFNGRTSFSPPTPDLAADGYPLAGGRLDYLDGQAVPALVYRRHLHTINVFVWRGQAGEASSLSREGYTIMEWGKDGLRYAAVSDLPVGEMKNFRRQFESAQADRR